MNLTAQNTREFENIYEKTWNRLLGMKNLGRMQNSLKSLITRVTTGKELMNWKMNNISSQQKKKEKSNEINKKDV